MVINLNHKKEPISKRVILQHVDDIDVYRKYFDGEISLKTAMLSPLMKDKSPSFGFFVGETGEICFKDHRLGGGDFVRFVQLKFGLTYFEALSKIATDFNICDGYICKSFEKSRFDETSKDYPSRNELLSRANAIKLGKNRRKWLAHDILYWQQFGISVSTLEKFNVEPLEYFHINNSIIKADRHCYCFIEYKDGKETYKIYQPFNQFYKWLNSHDDSIWQGWDMLPSRGHDLIITKSLKDVMALYEVAETPAVALQSENILPKIHVFKQLDERFINKYSLYDNDFDKETNWGRIFGEKIAETYGLIDIYIPDEYKSKDFSDLVKSVGKKEARNILENNLMMPF